MPKKTKDRYELREKLGEGGMGVVWRAYDNVLDADVALKMVSDVTDTAALQLFCEEWNKHAALVHPNIVEIRDVGSFDDNGVRRPYIVMPLLRGKTLAELIRSAQGPLPLERCLDIFAQACRGLQAAHDHGLLHRDVKPSNIFILNDDSVKIIDFGVARRLDMSLTVGRKGTLLYMSPEQVLSKPLSRASDVFSLAVVCYEALTGRQPFRAASEEAIVSSILRSNPGPASSLNPEIKSTVGQVLHKAMAKSPEHRFSTAKEFGEYLRRAYYDDSFTVFDPEKFAPRLQKASEAYKRGELAFADELVHELESEGYFSTELEVLSRSVKTAVQKRDVDRFLESAKARARDGEYRLALQRVQDALELDSRNSEALALQHEVEALRAEADAAEWLKVGHQHLAKFAFTHARQAAQRILETNPEEERALQFLSQLERKEAEYRRVREQKQQLYAAALEAEQRNDITSALSKMKQVLELDKEAPEIQEPGRSAAFQSLYNKLHSEHEAIASSYAEAKEALECGDYSRAAVLCDKFLERYPQHTLFKALKFDNDQRWRRAISARIIQVEEEAEREPDLNRRVSLLENVVGESPEVAEFARLLGAAREKRDLVNGIVQRARELAESEQYAEALVQWQTLEVIHPFFPDLSFEIDNVRQRRQFAERLARKSQWIAQINRAMDDGDFDESLRLLGLAEEDFPHDTELHEIQRHALSLKQAASQAEEFIQAGRLCLEEGRFLDGLDYLRRAHEIGPKTKAAKAELVEGLLRSATASKDNPKQARALLQELLNLEPGNNAAIGMVRFLDDQLEQEQVDHWISQARQFRTNNDFTAASGVLEHAIEQYPRNARLREVLREITNSRGDMRNRDLEVVRRKRLEADRLIDVPSITKHVDAVSKIARRYENDPEFEHESQLLKGRLQTIAGLDRHSDRALSVPFDQPPPFPAPDLKLVQSGSNRQTRRKAAWSVLGLLLITVAIVVALHARKVPLSSPSHPLVPPPLMRGAVTVRSTPFGAEILSNGETLGHADPELRLQLPVGMNSLEARLDGYVAQTQSVEVVASGEKQLSFKLVPGKQQLSIQASGSLTVDNKGVESVQGHEFRTLLDPGEHRVHWAGESGNQVTLTVRAEDGRPAVVVNPIRVSRNAGALVISTMNGQGLIFASPAAVLEVDGDSKGIADTHGVAVALDGGSHVFKLGQGAGARVRIIATGPGRVLAAAFDTDVGDGSNDRVGPEKPAVRTVSRDLPPVGPETSQPKGPTPPLDGWDPLDQKGNAMIHRTSRDLPPVGPETSQPKGPTSPLDGWDPQAWMLDQKGNAMIHRTAGITLFAAQPSRGTFVFSASLERSHIFGRRKLEWVANYRDPRDYFLFSLDPDGLEMFTVQNGEREIHGARVNVPKLNNYTILVQVQPTRITTSVQDGASWKLLNDWNNLPADVDRGKFGFKDHATISNFSFRSNK